MLVSFCKQMNMKPYSHNGYVCSSIILLGKVYTDEIVLRAINLHKKIWPNVVLFYLGLMFANKVKNITWICLLISQRIINKVNISY